MKQALVLQVGQLSDSMLITGIVRKLAEDHEVHCVVDHTTAELLRYNKNVATSGVDAPTLKDSYDIAINFSPQVTCTEIMELANADVKFGYGKLDDNLSFFNQGAELHYKYRYIGAPTRTNLLQLTYNLAGMKWQGEGYYLAYFPRNRAKKSLTGLVIRDQLLRTYIRENIKLAKSRIHVVPFKRDVLKQVDEINRCKNLVTDDYGILHLGLALRKNVEMIVKRKPTFGVEFFGSGNLHVFDMAALKEMA
jgi:hypothetical protein